MALVIQSRDPCHTKQGPCHTKQAPLSYKAGTLVIQSRDPCHTKQGPLSYKACCDCVVTVTHIFGGTSAHVECAGCPFQVSTTQIYLPRFHSDFTFMYHHVTSTMTTCSFQCTPQCSMHTMVRSCGSHIAAIWLACGYQYPFAGCRHLCTCKA